MPNARKTSAARGGIDLGGTKILAGVVERSGRIGVTKEVATPTDSQEAVLAGLDAVIAGIMESGVGAIGFGVPLNLDRRTQVIAALVEGNSIRSIERMTGIHRDTIMRLLVETGISCAAIMDEKMRELTRP